MSTCEQNVNASSIVTAVNNIFEFHEAYSVGNFISRQTKSSLDYIRVAFWVEDKRT